MTERYETARSLGNAPLMLIFREGTWDNLPFEIRLLRCWQGSEVCTGITAQQCAEIAASGYCIAAPAVQLPGAGNHCDDGAPNASEMAQHHPGGKCSSATCPILTPICGATSMVLIQCAGTEVRCQVIQQTLVHHTEKYTQLSDKSDA